LKQVRQYRRADKLEKEMNAHKHVSNGNMWKKERQHLTPGAKRAVSHHIKTTVNRGMRRAAKQEIREVLGAI
jgi:hypothetical protein